MKTLVAFLAGASAAAAILASGAPVQAQYLYGPYRGRPSTSFTPSQSGTRYNVYQPQRSFGSGYGSSFDQPRRPVSRGFGYSSGSYFGW